LLCLVLLLGNNNRYQLRIFRMGDFTHTPQPYKRCAHVSVNDRKTLRQKWHAGARRPRPPAPPARMHRPPRVIREAELSAEPPAAGQAAGRACMCGCAHAGFAAKTDIAAQVCALERPRSQPRCCYREHRNFAMRCPRD
jgi:hypothetical protein